MRFRLSGKFLLNRLRHSEEGAITVAAVLWVPFFILIGMGSIELGLLIFKQTLLERGVDMSTRILRLGIAPLPSHDELKLSICKDIGFISRCMDRLAVEVFPVDTTTWTASNQSSALCVDSSAPARTPQIVRGGSNQLMIIRACLKVDTMMLPAPLAFTNPIAAGLTRDANGLVSLSTVTAFVNEPRLGS